MRPEPTVGVFVMSHRQTATALRLKRNFAPRVETRVVDLGSPLSDDERAAFDAALPNLYYVGGLLDGIRWFDRGDDDVLLVITGDVEVDDPDALLGNLRAVMRDPRVGVYAPVSTLGRRSMRPRPGRGVAVTTWVEGYCFAARLGLLRALPLDVEVNRIGWGVDVYLGWLALRNGQVTVIDHRRPIFHPVSTSYPLGPAREQRDAWFARSPLSARVFRFLTSLPKAHHPWIAWLLLRLPWRV